MNVPKLRFKEFNDEYNNVKLKEVAEIYDGTHETPNYIEQGVKFVSVENISNLLDTKKYISESDFDNYKVKPKYNDVFMTRIGNIGTSSIYKSDEKLAFYVSLALLRSKNSNILVPDYLNQYIKNNSFQKELHNKTIHVAFPQKINTGEIGECKINFCSDKEQIKIANFLSLLDKKIELQTKKIEDLKLFKKGLNKFVFSSCTDEYKIENLIIEYSNKTTENNQYEVLSSTANGITFQNEYFNKQAASNNNTGYKIIPKGFITYRSMSDTGEFHFNIQDITDIGIVSPAYPVFNIKKNLVNKTYFVYYINENDGFKNEILSTKEGGTRYALSITKFKTLNILLPKIEEQIKYSKYINIIINKIQLEEKKLEKLIQLKKGLMQNMFV